jgi:ubiquinone/menaquinone biosynthesis C-methylase UbiE
MARDRDVAAFGERAQRYDEGWLGRLHHQIADRSADLALTCVPALRRILDVGCGTGYLLGRLAARAPQAEALGGIDAASAMIAVAEGAATDGRLHFVVGAAERLPWPAETFDLVVSTTSFDHWADAVLRERDSSRESRRDSWPFSVAGHRRSPCLGAVECT